MADSAAPVTAGVVSDSSASAGAASAGAASAGAGTAGTGTGTASAGTASAGTASAGAGTASATPAPSGAASAAAATDIALKFDAAKLNAMIAKVESITNKVSGPLLSQFLRDCEKGSACYNEKRNNILKTKLTNSQTAFANAPVDLSRAEKNYYVFNSGANGGEEKYNNMIIDRFATDAAQFKKNSIEKQQDFMANLSQILKQYQGETLFAKREQDLLNMRLKEYKDLLFKINKYEAILQTKQRKVVYEHKDMNTLFIYRDIMLFLYYSCIVAYVVFANFIPDKLYMLFTPWLMIIIASIVPIIFNIIMKWIFIFGDAISYWFADLIPNDVYTDL